MQVFALAAPKNPTEAVRMGAEPGTSFMAGGTDLMQLWKNDVEGARNVVDILGLDLRAISTTAQGLRLGALTTMAEAAEHAAVKSQAPAISEALLLSASPQIRNMGTLGGNLLQRARCGYFRDTAFVCNKRAPGSGCPAIAGENRDLAIFGGSRACIATHPSDFPVVLMALGARIEILRVDGATRRVPIDELYVLPGATPNVETVLQPGEIITAIEVPATVAARRSSYIKVRDRQSFAFALVSVAAGIEVENGIVRDARFAAGGVGTKPWRLTAVEMALQGKTLTPALMDHAATQASEGAQPQTKNAFKVALLRNIIRRSLQSLAA